MENSAPMRHVAGLDGVRGLAVVSVLVFHAGFSWASGGFIAVSSFLTLSGFLVGTMLLREIDESDRLDLVRFYGRRLRRLLPASLGAVVLCLVVGAVLHLPADPGALRWDAVSSSQFWTNWRFILIDRKYADLFSAPSPYTHYWSLAIEVQFYLVIPPILWVVCRYLGTRRAAVFGFLGLAAVASATWAAALFQPGVDNSRVYFGTDTRAAEFFIGTALAVAMYEREATPSRPAGPRGWWRSAPAPVTAVVGTAALAGLFVISSVATLSDPWVYRGGFSLDSLLTATVIWAVASNAPILSPALAWRPLGWLGRVSYGVYLYHWPIYLVLTEQRLGWGRWPTFALRLAVTVPLAAVSSHWFESRFRDRRRVGDSMLWRLAPATLAASVLVVVLVTAQLVPPVAEASARAPGPVIVGTTTTATATTGPTTVAPSSSSTSSAGSSTEAAPTAPSSTAAATTTANRATGGPRVLVVGDADGVAFGGRLAAWSARGVGYDVAPSASWACASVPCPTWAASWPGAVRAARADLLVVSVASFDQAALGAGLGAAPPADGLAGFLAEQFTQLFTSLTAAGVPVVWLPVPDKSGNDLRKRLDPRVDAVYRGLDAATTNVAGVRKVSLETQYNDRLREGGTPKDHFKVAAELAGPRLGAVLQSLIPGVPRVMMVGDSMARSLGAGLETWGAATGRAVWDVSRDGCGVLLEGDVQGLYAGLGPLPPDCSTGAASLPSQLAEFRPGVVIVLSTIWDLADRRLEGWPGVERPGDADFDAYMLDRYGAFVSRVAAAGATVVWMTVPCSDPDHGGLPFGTPTTRTAFEEQRRFHVNNVILPQLVASHPGQVRLADLAGAVCPTGAFMEKIGNVPDGRPDGIHFSDRAARWLADAYGASWING